MEHINFNFSSIWNQQASVCTTADPADWRTSKRKPPVKGRPSELHIHRHTRGITSTVSLSRRSWHRLLPRDTLPLIALHYCVNVLFSPITVTNMIWWGGKWIKFHKGRKHIVKFQKNEENICTHQNLPQKFQPSSLLRRSAITCVNTAAK